MNKIVRMNRSWSRDFALRVAQVHPRDPGARVARLQVWVVPKGLSPAQIAEFLTTGRVRSVPAGALLAGDPPIIDYRGQGQEVPESWPLAA